MISNSTLFLINTLVEGIFGVVVLAYPAFMFHDAAYNPTALTAGRMAGAAMLTLGVISYEGYKCISHFYSFKIIIKTINDIYFLHDN